MCRAKDYVYRLMTGLFAWIILDCFIVDFFYNTLSELFMWIWKIMIRLTSNSEQCLNQLKLDFILFWSKLYVFLSVD